MQRLEVSGAVRPIYGSLGVKRLMSKNVCSLSDGRVHKSPQPQNIILPIRSRHITVFSNPLGSWPLSSMLNNGSLCGETLPANNRQTTRKKIRKSELIVATPCPLHKYHTVNTCNRIFKLNPKISGFVGNDQSDTSIKLFRHLITVLHLIDSSGKQ